MRTIYFCSSNPHKVQEVQSLFSKLDPVAAEKIHLEIATLELPELQGEAGDISRGKCRAAFTALGKPVITEDTSLEFDALNGLPGPYIKWFLERLKPEGLCRMLRSYECRTAVAKTYFSYCDGDTVEPHVFEGATHGSIVSPRGAQTFGWDCVFEPKGESKTYAEMTKEEKNSLSHRSKALTKLLAYFKEQLDTK